MGLIVVRSRLKAVTRRCLPESWYHYLKDLRRFFLSRRLFVLFKMHKNLKRPFRQLEIGPGGTRTEGFETLSIEPGPNIDYVLDAKDVLPFVSGTFDTIYASHVLEHLPWYQLEAVLAEWVRILKVGGWLEVWVPDGLKICQAYLDAELNDKDYLDKDGWWRFNPQKDPCKWASGRLYSYGDGKGNPRSPNWHRSIFSPRYLRLLLSDSGLTDIRPMDHSEIRGYDHGWINLGMKGRK